MGESSLLSEQIRKGNTSAEEQLVLQHYQKVRLMLLARTQNGEAARDLAQDVLLAVIEALRRGRVLHPERLDCFIRGTARNLANNYLRTRRARQNEVPLPPELRSTADRVEAEDLAKQQLLRRGLESLSDSDREILRLAVVEELSPSLIGERFGISADAVRQRKCRAIRTLSEYVKAASHPDGGSRRGSARFRVVRWAEGVHEL